MASTFDHQVSAPHWLQHRFPRPDVAGLRMAMLVSMPVSLALWGVIVAAFVTL